jgi:hypothetical protein
MLEAAKHVRAMEDQGDREAVRRGVQELNELFRKLRVQIAGWSRDQQRQIGAGGLNTKIDLVESSLRRLMDGVGVATPDRNMVPSTTGGVEGSTGATDVPKANEAPVDSPPAPQPSI